MLSVIERVQYRTWDELSDKEKDAHRFDYDLNPAIV
jgi:hypothetical protein